MSRPTSWLYEIQLQTGEVIRSEAVFTSAELAFRIGRAHAAELKAKNAKIKTRKEYELTKTRQLANRPETGEELWKLLVA